jgi:glyoxylase I family protein
MAMGVNTAGVHHLTLTVSDVNRSRAFYEEVLGFETLMEFPPRVMLSNGNVGLALGPSPDPSRAIPDDSFDENRIGLDHLSLFVANRDEMENAVRIFDERGIQHGEIVDLGPDFGAYILSFRDPDMIQLELTAPYS